MSEDKKGGGPYDREAGIGEDFRELEGDVCAHVVVGGILRVRRVEVESRA